MHTTITKFQLQYPLNHLIVQNVNPESTKSQTLTLSAILTLITCISLTLIKTLSLITTLPHIVWPLNLIQMCASPTETYT